MLVDIEQCKRLKQKVKQQYGDLAICKVNSSTLGFKIDYFDYSKAEIAIHISNTCPAVVVWNLARRRKYIKGWSVTLTKNKWSEDMSSSNEINTYYRKMDWVAKKAYEKILIMNINVFENILYSEVNLSDLLLFDSNDTGYPNTLRKSSDNFDEEELEEKNRTKKTTSVYNRDSKFREKVLKRYDYECAICRCNERKILQAAHIKAISKKGTDNPKNGICLCANHHLMFDTHLIDIDFTRLILTQINNSVKEMAWYDEFMQKYNGKIKRGK